MRPDPKRGKKAKTVFDVLERYAGYSLLRCRPLTGRTHQIRVHSRHSGFPIVGDALYGGKPLLLSTLKPTFRLKGGSTENPLIHRVALHAETLALLHPATGEPLAIESPWPKDLCVAVKYLRRYAGRTGVKEMTRVQGPTRLVAGSGNLDPGFY
jgi:23S rRNA-/tRNA-specific pseudouridylate synthase